MPIAVSSSSIDSFAKKSSVSSSPKKQKNNPSKTEAQNTTRS